MAKDVSETRGSWVYVVPVSGLRLTEAVKNEFVISRVTFVSVEKLQWIRKRLGIPERVSEMKTQVHTRRFFSDPTTTAAVVRFTGKPAEITTKAIRLVVEELEILAASQLGYAKRRYNAFPTIHPDNQARMSYLCLNRKNRSRLSSYQVTGKLGELVLDDTWVNWQEKLFLSDLLRILNKNVSVNDSWRKNLYRVARLVGQSVTSNNVAQAFLLDMIALESLLTRQGDKYTEALSERVEAFIGWTGFWAVANYKDRIRNVYAKRCQYVHDGDDSKIEIKDLLFVDDILLNILANIVSHPEVFTSKDKLIEFATKVSAERILGIVGTKSMIRPKTLKFVSSTYTQKDYKKI